MRELGGCTHIGILPVGTAYSLIGSIQQAPDGRPAWPGPRPAASFRGRRRTDAVYRTPFRRSDGNGTESLAPRARSQPRVAM